jgi:hypothetical protein
MTEGNDIPSGEEIAQFKLEITRQRLQYLKLIRARGFHVEDEEVARLEAELQADKTNVSATPNEPGDIGKA